jgi:hypothetical protein
MAQEHALNYPVTMYFLFGSRSISALLWWWRRGSRHGSWRWATMVSPEVVKVQERRPPARERRRHIIELAGVPDGHLKEEAGVE